MTARRTRFFLIAIFFLSSMYFMVSCTPCTDLDGDGYGIATSPLCPHSELDCDDDNRYVYPTAFEFCNDGIDNQCPGDVGYGSVDEACEVLISAGCFDMGNGFFGEGDMAETPVHEVCISAFEMDVHEITNAEYAACVDDGGCTAPSNSNSGTRSPYYGDQAYVDFPVIYVDWFQADEYCAWAGKRLPTEAEWEYAARGGLAGNRYPWGATLSSTDANYSSTVGDTSAAESYPPNGYGLYDMAGNVREWTADWYDWSYYGVSPTNDPTGPATGVYRTLRGGSWYSLPNYLRVASRDFLLPNYGISFDSGVRCAW